VRGQVARCHTQLGLQVTELDPGALRGNGQDAQTRPLVDQVVQLAGRVDQQALSVRENTTPPTSR